MEKTEMERIQKSAQGFICRFCLAHPEHIASIQQIAALRKEMEIWKEISEERKSNHNDYQHMAEMVNDRLWDFRHELSLLNRRNKRKDR